MSGVIGAPTKEVIGTFNNISYTRYKGRFTGATPSGRFDVPYEITTPTNPREGAGLSSSSHCISAAPQSRAIVTSARTSCFSEVTATPRSGTKLSES